jgi:hypothetical protein
MYDTLRVLYAIYMTSNLMKRWWTLREIAFYEKEPFLATIRKDGIIMLSRFDDDGVFIASTILHVDVEKCHDEEDMPYDKVSLIAHGKSCGTPNRHKIVAHELQTLLSEHGVSDFLQANDRVVMKGIYEKMIDDES